MLLPSVPSVGKLCEAKTNKKKITKPLGNKYKIEKKDVKRVKKNLYLQLDKSVCRVGLGDPAAP